MLYNKIAYVQLSFERNTYLKSSPKPLVKLTDRQSRAVEYVNKNGEITNKIHQELNNIFKATATRDLTELVKLGLLQKIGTSGEGVKYILVGS